MKERDLRGKMKVLNYRIQTREKTRKGGRKGEQAAGKVRRFKRQNVFKYNKRNRIKSIRIKKKGEKKEKYKEARGCVEGIREKIR